MSKSKKPRKHFTHDYLLSLFRRIMSKSLEKHEISEPKKSSISNIDCIMSALAVFTFKFPSLLQFDKAKHEDEALRDNLNQLFSLENCPCDTYMRERLDMIDPAIFRDVFRALFATLQRANILENFRFFGDHYLISVDGTGTHSSTSVHCDNCCKKNHRDGSVTYYHQLLTAALVHPDQKVVYPFFPEPIEKTDGEAKNDCEFNAFKRWIPQFRREHPHLKVVILADGLSSKEPLISLLRQHRMSFILVCRESDHKYLSEQVKAAQPIDKPPKNVIEDGVKRSYEYILDVPLNDSKQDCRVNVVRFSETKTVKVKKVKAKEKQQDKTINYMWVTDLHVDLENIEEFVKGGRSRWKIENETFNTLKNQGYNFEHNFGHGEKHLHTVFANLMLLAFFVDQCLQQLNKRFQAAVNKLTKRTLWERMRSCSSFLEIPNFESLYHFLTHPPPSHAIPSVI